MHYPLIFFAFIVFALCIPIMVPTLQFLLFLSGTLLFMQTLAEAATCSDCFIHSRAAYYPNSYENGTDSKRPLIKYLITIRLTVHLLPIEHAFLRVSFMNCSRQMRIWFIRSNPERRGCISCIWPLPWWCRLWCLLPGTN